MKLQFKILLLCFCLVVIAQKNYAQIDRLANYVFTNDSVAGFDEQNASTAALANGCYGREFKVYLYKAKREYINSKYNIQPAKIKQTLFQNPVGRPNPLPGGICNNEDFELGTVQGWTLSSGTNPNSCASPNLTGSSLYTVMSSPVSDSRISGQISSYFDASSGNVPSGSYFIRLNDANAGAKAVRLSKSFIPTANSALFQYAYIGVIQDGSHDCCDQAGFNIKITVTNTTTNAS